MLGSAGNAQAVKAIEAESQVFSALATAAHLASLQNASLFSDERPWQA